jgi:predicted metal-dependent enzyme (double-stranded beta helix superfamily)
MPTYSLDSFVADMEALVAADNIDRILNEGAGNLERFVSQTDCVPEHLRQVSGKGARPNHATYVLHTSHSGLSVTAVVWGPDDGLGAHDHHTWGLIGVAANEITEARYRRLDDGSDPDYAKLELDHKGAMRHGQVSVMTPDVDEIHAMHNATGMPTIEVHVYGKDLKGLERCLFDVSTGNIKHFATKAYDNC